MRDKDKNRDPAVALERAVPDFRCAAKKLVTGRCWKCDRLYQWKPSKGRRLKDAACRVCKRKLRQTAFALIEHDKAQRMLSHGDSPVWRAWYQR